MLDKEWFVEIVKAGVEPSIIFVDGKIWYNLNTGAKSGLYIRHLEDDLFEINVRYNGCREENIHSLRDVLYLVLSCMCGRDYVGEPWTKLMMEHGLASVKTITKVNYAF